MNLKKISLRKLNFFCLLVFITSVSVANSNQKIYNTGKIHDANIVIDGNINEQEWGNVEWGVDFIQTKPSQREAPSQKTEFKILYDVNYLYVAVVAYDNEPDKIDKRLSRRDGFDADYIGIGFDSYFDKKTSFIFVGSVSGVKSDKISSGDGGSEDNTWDPIWYLKTSVTDSGWIAEIKIPFDQLRFSKVSEQIWGLQVGRFIYRNQEESFWTLIPQDEGGFTRHFGELHGIAGIKSKTRKEITPYILSSYEIFPDYESEKFNGTKRIPFGIDGKIGITNNFTIDYTVNPDFGQVEADPSEVNLTAFETFFQEKRPFFIEGKNITDFKLSIGTAPFSNDNIFYSRRIGRQPHFSPELEDWEKASISEYTTIHSAVKLTGKTPKGLSIGIIESIADGEYAIIDSSGINRKASIEPVTNYLIARVQQEMNAGNTIFGSMLTSTNRAKTKELITPLHHSAYTGGFDYTQFFNNKKYYLITGLVFSHLAGSEEAILESQESSLRYFQRLDAKYITIDSNRTSLTGSGGSLHFGKAGNKKMRFVFWLTYRSPSLDLNDVGYQYISDLINQIFWIDYEFPKPFSIFRRLGFGMNEWFEKDFDGNKLSSGGNLYTNIEFKNYWYAYAQYAKQFGTYYSPKELRGGPLILMPENFNYNATLKSDSRRKIVAEIGAAVNAANDKSYDSENYNIGFEFQPVNILSFNISLNYNEYFNKMQYVSTEDFGIEKRYIFGTIDQKTISSQLRFDLSITPDLTIQYYGQPFISAGRYFDFKRIANPLSLNNNERYHIYSDTEIIHNTSGEQYEIYEDEFPGMDYRFDEPDFKVQNFNSNLVFRWEYIPGSTVYLVWSHKKDIDNDGYSEMNYNKDFSKLFTGSAYDIFMVKFSYRFAI